MGVLGRCGGCGLIRKREHLHGIKDLGLIHLNMIHIRRKGSAP